MQCSSPSYLRVGTETRPTRPLGPQAGDGKTTGRRDITCLEVLGQQRLRQRLWQLVAILPRNHEVESGTKLRERQRPVAIHVAQLPASTTHLPSRYLRDMHVCNHGGDKRSSGTGSFDTRQASLPFTLDPNLHIRHGEDEAT